MHEYLKPLPLVAMALAVITLASLDGRSSSHTGGAASSAPQAAAISTSCETARRGLRENTQKAWGYDAMIAQMKRISHEIKPDERKDLARLTATIDAPKANPTLQASSSRMIKTIYADAIDRSGLSRGLPEQHEEIQRLITINPTGSDPLIDGYTVVVGSSPRNLDKVPNAGDIIGAFLAVSADQTRYELILVRATHVAAGAHDGYDSDGEYLSLQKYVDQNTACAKLSSR